MNDLADFTNFEVIPPADFGQTNDDPGKQSGKVTCYSDKKSVVSLWATSGGEIVKVVISRYWQQTLPPNQSLEDAFLAVFYQLQLLTQKLSSDQNMVLDDPMPQLSLTDSGHVMISPRSAADPVDPVEIDLAKLSATQIPSTGEQVVQRLSGLLQDPRFAEKFVGSSAGGAVRVQLRFNRLPDAVFFNPVWLSHSSSSGIANSFLQAYRNALNKIDT